MTALPVTRRHIAAGARQSANGCAVALALEAVFPGALYVQATYVRLVVTDAAGIVREANTPHDLAVFMGRFDHRIRTARPAVFDVVWRVVPLRADLVLTA